MSKLHMLLQLHRAMSHFNEAAFAQLLHVTFMDGSHKKLDSARSRKAVQSVAAWELGKICAH